MKKLPLSEVARFVAKRTASAPEEMRRMIGRSSEEEQANNEIVRAGTALLPDYSTFTQINWNPSPKLLAPAISATAFEMLEAQSECALLYQNNHNTPDKAAATVMLRAAGYAYEGRPPSVQDAFRRLAADMLPESLHVLYDESTGLLSGAQGLRVWLGEYRDGIVVAFSGTDKRDLNMVYADIVQLSVPSLLYLKAAGLLSLLMDGMPGKTFYVTGHSLGGGLSQFSVTANMVSDRLSGYAFNPAGLSMVSVRNLGADRLTAAAQCIWVFRTCMDTVSAIGGKLGCVTTLPETARNGHSLEDLDAGMQEYLLQKA